MISSKNPLIRDVLGQLAVHTPTDPCGWLQSAGLSFAIRLLDLQRDLPVLHSWVNQDYALPFWGMNGSYEQFYNTYQAIRRSASSESLIGWSGNERVCQLDIYDPAEDPIHACYDHQPGDIGFHLLMAPGQRPLPNGTAKIVWFFLQVFFQSEKVNRIIGEPDVRNKRANHLLHQLQFEQHENLTLPDKEAAFYTLTRQRYEQQTRSTHL